MHFHFNDLQGSLMEGDDLDRVQADNADAVLILTNKYCQVYFYTFLLSLILSTHQQELPDGFLYTFLLSLIHFTHQQELPDGL